MKSPLQSEINLLAEISHLILTGESQYMPSAYEATETGSRVLTVQDRTDGQRYTITVAAVDSTLSGEIPPSHTYLPKDTFGGGASL